MSSPSWLVWVAILCLCCACASTRTIGQSDINEHDVQDTQAQSFQQNIEDDVPTNTHLEAVNTGAWLRMLGMTHDRVAIARLNTDEIILWGTQTQRSFTNITQVAYGLYHTVLLYDDGSVEVYGTNEFGQLDIPDPQLRFEYIAAGETFTVGLTSDGRVVGWGRAVVEVEGTQYSITPYPLDVIDAVQFAVYKHYTLVSHRDGTISLWGDDQTKRAANIDFTVATHPTVMAINSNGIFVVDHAQQPHWWPFYVRQSDAEDVPIVWPQGIVQAVPLQNSLILLVTERGEAFHLRTQSIKQLPQTMRHDAPIVEMDGYIMGLDGDNKFFMWHANDLNQPFPLRMPNAVELSVKWIGNEVTKALYTIYRFNDDSIRIYENGVEALNYPYEVSAVAWMNDDKDYFAVISPSGDTVVWGNTDPTRHVVPDWARPLRYIDLPTEYVHSERCSVGILADGSFIEWDHEGISPCRYRFGTEPSLQGRDMYPRPPAEATQLIKVVRPGDKTTSVIGLRADGQVVAWGRYGSERPATVPSNATDVIDIVNGYKQIMALRRDGQIVVWNTDKGESLAPAEAMPSRMVRVFNTALAGEINVSLRIDGTVVVWTDKFVHEYAGFADAIDVDVYNGYSYSDDQPTFVVLHQDGTITHFGAVYTLPTSLRIRMATQ